MIEAQVELRSARDPNAVVGGLADTTSCNPIVWQVRPGPHRVVLITDRVATHCGLAEYLNVHEFDTSVVAASLEFELAVHRIEPDMVLLDVNMPNLSNSLACRQLRAHGVTTPVVVLGRSCDIVDHVLALEMGADGFIPAPLERRLVLATTKCLLRRPVPQQPIMGATGRILEVDHFQLDRGAMIAKWRGKDLCLAASEFHVLWVLARYIGQKVTDAELIDALEDWQSGVTQNALRLRLTRLRRQLQVFGLPSNTIERFVRVGYRLNRTVGASETSFPIATLYPQSANADMLRVS
jgi:DNA-binding response OmpR family regulator